MDSGLRVVWPLSPYATALAAGALVGFCVALWRHNSTTKEKTGRDPRGQISGRDLEPKDKENVKKKREVEIQGSNFSIPTFRNVNTGSLCPTGTFGAIPRTGQRSAHLFSALRRRYVERECKSWQELNPATSNFSCIYQHSFSLGNEVPKLNARFVLNVSPYLNQYLRRPRDFQVPESSRKWNFDVSINPEILKDKPISRSAVCLTLEKQLHKILNGEPWREIKSSERDIQTSNISDEREDHLVPHKENSRNSELEFNDDISNDLFIKPSSEGSTEKINTNTSLWDSGYCEKTFDDRCSSPTGTNERSKFPLACRSELNDSDDVSEVLSTAKRIDSSVDTFRYSCDALKCFDAGTCSKIVRDCAESLCDTPNISDDFAIDKNKNSDQLIKTVGSEGEMNVSLNNNLTATRLKNLSEESEDSSDEIISVITNTKISNSEIQLKPNVEYISEEIDTKNILSKNLGKIDEDSFYQLVDTKKGNSCIEKHSEVINIEYSSDENRLSSSSGDISFATDGISKIKIENEEDSAIRTLVNTKHLDDSKKNLSGNFNLERCQLSTDVNFHAHEYATEEDIFQKSESTLQLTKYLDSATRAARVDLESEDKSIEDPMDLPDSNLEGIQSARFDSGEELSERAPPSPALEAKNAVLEGDVTPNVSSRDVKVFDERGARRAPRQMDRETGERSVAVESSVTTETTLRDATRLSTAVISRLTLDDWTTDNSVSVKTTVSEEIFRPTFEEPLSAFENVDKNGHPLLPDDSSLPPSPRVERLKGLLNRDEERRSRAKSHHLAAGHVEGDREGEWDRLLRDVLASVSELERWERDVSADAEDAEHHPEPSQSDSSFSEMEEGALLSPSKGETPTKIKSLRFKLDPDVFDVPSDDSFYDDEDEEVRRGWKKQSKYRAYSSLEVKDEPVRLVSVHASVVPAGQKMVARPVGIDLRVRLTEERQSKRAHVSTSPSQAKRRSPVSDRGVGWCQELSPVTENVDWRETFTPVNPEFKSVPNGILKTPSPKTAPPPVESPNPFKFGNGVTTNGGRPVIDGKHNDKPKPNIMPWRPTERKPFLLPRKKFEPDPEAIERITGYKIALSKPPLPPPAFDRINATKIAIRKAELARKQYLDSKAALSASKADGMKKFQQFLSQARDDRAKIVTSVPDLAAIERAVTEQWMKEMKERVSVSPRETPVRENGVKADDATVSRGSTPDDKWSSYVQSCRQHLGRRSQSMTYLETDIDIIPVLDEDDKCVSTSALDEPDEALPDPDVSDTDRSHEDLDDSGRAKSEHELRIERCLRSLPLPDWYQRSEKTKTGFLLGSSAKEKRGWAAAKSLASSTSSLASCGLRRPVRSLRSSRENIPWSRSSASPDGPTLSLALAKAFREPYLGWRARTPTSSGVSSSPRASPPSWGATTTDDEVNGVSFDGEDAFGRTTSSEDDRKDEPLSLDDTGADAVTVSMDTNDPVKLPGGEDTCDDINNMSMDTCELLFDPASVAVPVHEDHSPQADTGDDIDNLSTDTTTTEGRKLDPKLKRYSYSQSIYHSEWEEEEESRGDRKVVSSEDRDPSSASPNHKVVWIESSFVGSRTTTSIMVLPEKKAPTPERPASR